MYHHDVIVVGARVAGAATALQLARAGHRVLVLDRDRRGADTLSTHALMRPAVLQLERWGVLDEVVAAGTPAVDRVVFHYDDRQVPLELNRSLYAPRRTVLDPLLVAAAERAGAEFGFGVDVRGLVLDECGAVVGVRVRHGADRSERVLGARVVVGADGRRSGVAAAVDAPVTRQGHVTASSTFGYWSGVETAGFEWCWTRGAAAGVIPTNDGRACVFVTVPDGATDPTLRDADGFVDRLAAIAPDVGRRVAAGRLHGPLRTFAGLAGWLRRPWGPGWALVGDAGYFKDPSTAHGISDALRDAELLADALHDHLAHGAPAEDALATYEQVRDRLSVEFFDLTERIASLDWTLDEVQALHLRMSALMQAEVDELTSRADRPRAPLVA